MAGETHLNRRIDHDTHQRDSIAGHGSSIVPRGKKKYKGLFEEMNKKYNTERGSHRIIIRSISDVAIRMDTKIM
jgi:hypothetical protein